MVRDCNDIPRFKDVSDADWNDWHWQLRNRLTTTEDFDRCCNLTTRSAPTSTPAWASSASA